MAAPDVAAWLGLTALATIGDVVSIDSPANRFFVQQGLQQINNGADPAIAQLVFNAQRALPIGEEDIAFTLAPIINAPGRLGQSVAWGFLTGEGAPAELNVHRMFANVRYLQEELDAQRGRIDGIMSNEEARRLRWMLKTQLDDIPDDADAPLSESEQAFVDARRADYKLDAPDQDWQLHGHNQIDPSHHLYMLLSRETNELRKSLEWALLKEARAQAKQVLRQQPDAQTLLVAGAGWNEGLVGIVAGRLKEEYGMPVVAASINAKAGTCKCSGRSIKVPEHPVDIGEAFRTLNKQGVLSKAGGHPMAAGASFTLDKLDAFRAGLEQELGEATHAARAAQRMDVQAVIDLGSLSAARPGKEVQTMQHWLDEAGKLGPFGEGNAKPRVVLSNVYVSDMRRSRDNKHLFFQLRQPGPGGVSVDGVAFHAAGTALEGALDEASRNRAYVAGTLDVREVSRKDGPHTRLQLRLDDVLVPPQRATDRLRRGTTDLSEAMEMPQGDACVPALVRQQGRAAGR
ncbi:MAG: hypothetical protein CMM94_01320 [Rickettsiales bacterium]|nr:hypothetical protein [Rickettsiales bacterium]